MTEKNLKQLLSEKFKIDLPISGGNGLSLKAAIIIEQADDGIALEYKIIDYLAQMEEKPWKFISQTLIQKDERYYDELNIALGADLGEKRQYFFDITADYLSNQKIIEAGLK